MSRTIIILVMTCLVSLWATATEPQPAAAPAPSTRPFVPPGERAFYDSYINVIPGTRTWVQWLKGDIWHYNTTQSVGDGAGMMVYAPAGENIGWLCSMDTGVQPVKNKDGQVMHFALTEYKGVSLWIKGDGSDASAVFSTGWDSSNHKFRVPLKDTQWHKVFLAWDKWDEPIADAWNYLTYSIERSDNSRSNWYVVDRVHLYKEEKVEDISPTPEADPPGNLPASDFVSGSANIKNTLAKLAGRKPVKIVVAGDSVLLGQQLGYTKKNYNYPAIDQRNMTYWKVLTGRLKQHYGYNQSVSFLRTYDPKRERWYDELSKDTRAYSAASRPAATKEADTQEALAGPEAATRPSGDLQVIAIAVGGWTAQMGLDNIDQIIGEKPDLVIWAYGPDEVGLGRPDAFAKAGAEAVKRLQAARIEVLLQTPPPSADLMPRSALGGLSTVAAMGSLADHTRNLAKGCALADMEKAFKARGILYVGDIYADATHPNHLGHEIMADVLDALLTGRDVKTWTRVPTTEPAGR